MDKQTVVHQHNGVLFKNKKKKAIKSQNKEYQKLKKEKEREKWMKPE